MLLKDLLRHSAHGFRTTVLSVKVTVHFCWWVCSSIKKFAKSLCIFLLQRIPPFIGIANGLSHIHLKGILHNDLKSNNIALSDCVPQAAKQTSQKLELWPTIIDFSKACPEKDGKKYHLLSCEKEAFKTRYPHLAPDLVNGKVRQNVFSDIYSFGQVILRMAVLADNSKTLMQLSNQSTSYTYKNRQELSVTVTKLKSLL